MVITQCPECQALFRVSEGQMRLAQGQVRCGACLTVFDAKSHALQRVAQP
ncbi:MAG: zinc-ribbon domain-containing protein, partial [Oceanospirillaceae bacterium]|nr:zinc-ribbon domain-containing protein [Oceanospirillaceae bacterium]